MNASYLHRASQWMVIGGVLLTAFASCKKTVAPDVVKPVLGQVSFLNLSEDLGLQVSQAYKFSQYSYVLIDHPDTNYVPTAGNLSIPYPYFYFSSPELYPAVDQYNLSQAQPWVLYGAVGAGEHNLILTDTGRRALLNFPLAVREGTPATVWFMDNLGQYYDTVTSDVFQAQEGKAGLRFADASADAGPVTFTINQQPVAGYPDSLVYGTITPFVPLNAPAGADMTNPVMDTLKIRFYSQSDPTTVLVRNTLIVQSGHAYTVVLAGYEQPQYYIRPYSGQPASVQSHLRVLLFKNN